ncbi:hypothetical protein Ddc_05234 [Ditylenchus destructor]|nr:hypothetical protein Ddc_05234 [Ditylenchus destructor]
MGTFQAQRKSVTTFVGRYICFNFQDVAFAVAVIFGLLEIVNYFGDHNFPVKLLNIIGFAEWFSIVVAYLSRNPPFYWIPIVLNAASIIFNALVLIACVVSLLLGPEAQHQIDHFIKEIRSVPVNEFDEADSFTRIAMWSVVLIVMIAAYATFEYILYRAHKHAKFEKDLLSRRCPCRQCRRT